MNSYLNPAFRTIPANWVWQLPCQFQATTLPIFRDNIGESARNRFGRPYISGRPLLACDRHRIVYLFKNGFKKIEIARCLGITHSCVSKVIRKFEDTGIISQEKQSRTASCACPGESAYHDPNICRHLRYSPINKKNQPKPKKFTIDWILSDWSRQDKFTQSQI